MSLLDLSSFQKELEVVKQHNIRRGPDPQNRALACMGAQFSQNHIIPKNNQKKQNIIQKMTPTEEATSTW
jgi:hypothetical protein